MARTLHSFSRPIQGWLSGLLLVFAASFGLAALAQGEQPQYRIGPGDTIRIQVFQNPDLTLETRVSEVGTISYPLIGTVRIGGMTTAEAEKTIAKALQSGGFIKQPQVNIEPLQIRSNQVSVLGQVSKPGRFPLDTFNIRLSEMIAIAGGIAPTGADVIVVTGTRDGRPFHREIDIVGLFLKNRLQDDVVVAGGDVIYVPRAPVFYIYGEVQRPGSYRIERGMTIRQALAQGGGPTPRGTERNLEVIRQRPHGNMESLTPDLNSLVRPDDVLHVRETLF
jgi:polysaccharide biosynthesis/export protein